MSARSIIWLQWNHNGSQTRKSAKTLNWEIAEQRARHKEQGFVDEDLGKPPAPGAAKRVDHAIAQFMDSKRGGLGGQYALQAHAHPHPAAIVL